MSPPCEEFNAFINENDDLLSALENTINQRAKLLKEKEDSFEQ